MKTMELALVDLGAGLYLVEHHFGKGYKMLHELTNEDHEKLSEIGNEAMIEYLKETIL